MKQFYFMTKSLYYFLNVIKANTPKEIQEIIQDILIILKEELVKYNYDYRKYKDILSFDPKTLRYEELVNLSYRKLKYMQRLNLNFKKEIDILEKWLKEEMFFTKINEMKGKIGRW